MTEQPIACILSSRWVPKVGKHIVKLGFTGERAKDVWMTDKQLAQIEALFTRTPHGHSSDRLEVVGVWNDKGYYAYARLVRADFIPPVQYSLKDLKEE